MSAKLAKTVFIGLILSASAFAQNFNRWQPLQPSKNNAAARLVAGESTTGASFALLMDESSGGITDVIGSVPLAVYNAANTYSVTGSNGYDPGITMNAVAGGFAKQAAVTTGLDFGTGDSNIFLALRVNGTMAAFSEVFITTVREAGMAGFSIRALTSVDDANSSVQFTYIATDLTTVNAQWTGGAAGAAVFSGGIHTWEFRTNRAGNNIELFVDGTTQGTVSIATLSGKTLSTSASSGIGVGADWRAGVNRNVPITVFFVRVKKSLT